MPASSWAQAQRGPGAAPPQGRAAPQAAERRGQPAAPWGVTLLPTPSRLVPAVSTAEPVRSSKVEEDQLPPEHTVSQYETCKIRTIKAGTLEKLVENLLTAFGDNDFTYISIFLSTYRAFASAKEVLELLLDRDMLGGTIPCVSWRCNKEYLLVDSKLCWNTDVHLQP
ncbi:uncharacterized protein AAGF69_010301 [Amazona ochrocephala]